MRIKVLAVQDPLEYHGSWPPNEDNRMSAYGLK